MKNCYLASLLTASLSLILIGCDLQPVEENKQSDVEIYEQPIQSYESNSPTTDLDRNPVEIEVPDTEIPAIEVPDAEAPDVDMSNTNSENQ